MKTYSIDAEVFAAGKWNNLRFTTAELDDIVATFNEMGDKLRVPLKFGHNNEQPMTDGQPALGWVSRVWRKGEKMMAHLTEVPEVVYNAIQKKMYRNVSIELLGDVEYKGKKFKWMLSGVALLGADVPAVNTLSDLTHYLSAQYPESVRASFAALKDAQGFDFAQRQSFTTHTGGPAMDEKELEVLKEKAAKFEAAEAENKRLKEANEKAEAERKTAAFTAAKNDVAGELEQLVKDGKLLPGQRDKFIAEMQDDAALDRVKFAVQTIKEATVSATAPPQGEQGSSGSGGATGTTGRADEVLLGKIQEYTAKNPQVNFMAAKRIVLSQDPKLAKEYAMLNVDA